MFRLIKQCNVAKDAREILKTAHEGTSKVKSSRLQLLTTKFENLKMMEDVNIQSIYDIIQHIFLDMDWVKIMTQKIVLPIWKFKEYAFLLLDWRVLFCKLPLVCPFFPFLLVWRVTLCRLFLAFSFSQPCFFLAFYQK